MNHSISSFLSGCADTADLLFAAKQVDKYAEQDQPNSSFFGFNKGAWGKYKGNVGWPAIAMAWVKPADQARVLVAVSPQGDVWEVVTMSLVETTGQVSKNSVQLRSLVSIEDLVYACGMGRQVFRREQAGRWKSIGPPRPPASDKSVVGFEDIDGYAATDIYAAGWQGEIWRFDGRRWHQIDSPVSANLNAVCCGNDGNVYAVGDGGVMLRGRADKWEVLETGRDENLMDVCAYDGKVYVVTDFRILVLKKGELVNDERFVDDADQPATCLYLLAAPDGLFSMGPKDLFILKGKTWKRLV